MALFWMAIVGIAATVIGLMVRHWIPVVLGFVCVSPFMLYLLLSRLWPLAAIALAGQVAAAVAVRRGRLAIAWMSFLLTPAAIAYVSLVLMGATLKMYGY